MIRICGFVFLVVSPMLIGCRQELDPFVPRVDQPNLDMGGVKRDATLTSMTEIPCNDVDDDEDGQIDELAAVSCTDGVGVCTGTGTLQCVLSSNGEQELACVHGGFELRETADFCGDGQDNDCDGLLDEDCICMEGERQDCYPADLPTLNRGLCRGGIQTCRNGQYQACEGAVSPTNEVCNGLDDDCDDRIDEGEFPCQTECGSGTGQCEEVSPSLFEVSQCSARLPSDESCDGKDNDCDGKTDEEIVINDPQCAAVGLCGGVGVCVGGAIQCDERPPEDCECETLEIGERRHALCRTEQMTYEDAQADCIEKGFAGLASIDSFSEHLSIFHELRRLQFNGNVWIGGSRMDAIAQSSSAVAFDPYLFADGHLAVANQRNRITLDGSTGLLETRAQTAQRFYVCEGPCDSMDRDLDGFSQCAGDCDDSEREISPRKKEIPGDGSDNNCNGVIDEIMPEICLDGIDNDGNGQDDEIGCILCDPFWVNGKTTLICAYFFNHSAAGGYCADYGLRLPEPQSFADWRLTWVWLGQRGNRNGRADYWFGLVRDSMGFSYPNSAVVLAEDDPQWSAGEPNNAYPGEECVHFWCVNANGCSGKWNDRPCTIPLRFWCETP